MRDLFSLGDHFVNTFPKEWPHDGEKCPIDVVECQNCTLVQLKHSAPNDLLYSNHYWYKSAMNPVIKKDLWKIAADAVEYMEPGDTVLDIGANDGTLLSYFPEEVEKVGVEPADNLQEDLVYRADKVIHGFWEYEDWMEGKAMVITAIGMFYDLEDPIKFVTDARKALHKDGVFIAQLMCAKQMAENNDIGNLCHEHLEFYTIPALEYLFDSAGLEIFQIEENGINGGSYKVLARHATGNKVPLPGEKKIDWDAFVKNIEEQKENTVKAVREAVAKGKQVFAFGASTKGNTILQYFGLGSDLITGAMDKDSEKWGRYMLNGTPIVSEHEGRKADVLLVLPYGFIDHFVKKEADWLSDPDHYFIQPLPEFKEIHE